jgi:hypothetical protein
MSLKQHLMHGLDPYRTPQDHEIFVSTQAFALTFAEFKIAQVYAQ